MNKNNIFCDFKQCFATLITQIEINKSNFNKKYLKLDKNEFAKQVLTKRWYLRRKRIHVWLDEMSLVVVVYVNIFMSLLLFMCKCNYVSFLIM
jgi:hypothetical protein